MPRSRHRAPRHRAPRPARERVRPQLHPQLHLEVHREALLACRRCPDVVGPVVTGQAVASEIFLIGQAPGPREGLYGKPFAWTAGRTLFRWFASLGVDEETFRARVFMAAVTRCFPGKARGGGGDRVPSRDEIARCREWMAAEAELVRPALVVPVGQLAITQILGAGGKLADVVGGVRRAQFFGRAVDCVALPHPSGLSTWHKVEPGKTLLARALETLGAHPAWRRTFPSRAAGTA